jgi:hypothetical protein
MRETGASKPRNRMHIHRGSGGRLPHPNVRFHCLQFFWAFVLVRVLLRREKELDKDRRNDRCPELDEMMIRHASCFLDCYIGSLSARKPYGQEPSQRQLISWPCAGWTLDAKSRLQLDCSVCDIGDSAVQYGSQYKDDGNAKVSGVNLKELSV